MVLAADYPCRRHTRTERMELAGALLLVLATVAAAWSRHAMFVGAAIWVATSPVGVSV